MKKKMLLTLGCAMLFSTAAFAQAWQWKDKDGRVVISDSPPPAATQNVKQINKHVPAPDEIPLQEREALNAQQDEDFQKRFEEQMKKEEEEAKAEKEARAKKRACSTARASLADRKSAPATTNPARRAARREDIQRLEESVAENCVEDSGE